MELAVVEGSRVLGVLVHENFEKVINCCVYRDFTCNNSVYMSSQFVDNFLKSRNAWMSSIPLLFYSVSLPQYDNNAFRHCFSMIKRSKKVRVVNLITHVLKVIMVG